MGSRPYDGEQKVNYKITKVSLFLLIKLLLVFNSFFIFIYLKEAEQYIPYDIDDVNIDYQVLGESEFSPDQLNILLVAVKKDLVAEYMELIQMAGLTPKIIDVDTFA